LSQNPNKGSEVEDIFRQFRKTQKQEKREKRRIFKKITSKKKKLGEQQQNDQKRGVPGLPRGLRGRNHRLGGRQGAGGGSRGGRSNRPAGGLEIGNPRKVTTRAKRPGGESDPKGAIRTGWGRGVIQRYPFPEEPQDKTIKTMIWIRKGRTGVVRN